MRSYLTARHQSFEIIIFWLMIALSLLAYVMTHRLSHDEHMYITAGVLVRQHRLYQDFAYLQMPYLPLLYGFVYQLTGTSYYLLWGRIVTFLLGLTTLVVIYLIAYRFSKSSYFSAISVTLFCFHAVILEAIGYSTNNAIAMAFSILGLYLFVVSTQPNSIKFWGVFSSGVALAIALGSKLYYAAIVPPFLGVACCYPGLTMRQRGRKIIFPWVAGGILGLLPILRYWIADPNRFIFNNLGYHAINTQWRELTGHTSGMTLVSKLNYGRWILSFPSNLLLIVGIASAILLCLIPGKNKHQDANQFKRQSIEFRLILLLTLVTTLAAFAPTPLFIHYFAMPISFAIASLISSYPFIPSFWKPTFKGILSVLAIAAVTINGHLLFNSLVKLPHLENWSAIAIHQTAQQIRQQLGELQAGDKLATLSPLYAIEAEIPIYPELATGPFLYRIGDLLSAERRNQVIGTSPQTIPQLFSQQPPKAILVGFGKALDRALIQYAETQNYREVNQDFAGGTLYIRNY